MSCMSCVAVRDRVEVLSEQLLMERGGPLTGPSSGHLRSLQQLAQDSIETADGQAQSTKTKSKQGEFRASAFDMYSFQLQSPRQGNNARLHSNARFNMLSVHGEDGEKVQGNVCGGVKRKPGPSDVGAVAVARLLFDGSKRSPYISVFDGVILM